MGLGGIGSWQLLVILAIVVMLFGTKRLRTLGSDLGSAIRGFRESVKDDNNCDGSAQEFAGRSAAANSGTGRGDGRAA